MCLLNRQFCDVTSEVVDCLSTKFGAGVILAFLFDILSE